MAAHQQQAQETRAGPAPAGEAAGGAVSKKVLAGLFAAYIVALAVFCVIFRKTLFAWPAGIVTGNLIASCIWAPVAVIHLDRLARKHHAEHMDLLRLHHRQQMEALSRASSPPAG